MRSGSGIAPLYAVLMGLVIAAAHGWLFVAGYALLAGPWLGWRLGRRAA